MDAAGITNVLRQLGCRTIHPSGDHLRANCPLAPVLHSKGVDNHPSFFVKIEPDEASCYHCFSCDSKGTFLGLLYDMIRQGISVDEDLLNHVRAEEKHDPRHKRTKYVDQFGKTILKGLKKRELEVWSEEEYAPFAGKVPKYILDRGVDIETCKHWEIGYDKEKERVLFPVRRNDGVLVGAVGRTIHKGVEPTYLTYFNFSKSQFLFGEHLLKSAGEPTIAEGMGYGLPAEEGVILVEGMMDVLKLYQMGYENVAAIMTSNVSGVQVRKVLRLGRPVYLMLDWDKAGVQGRKVVVPHLFERQLVFDVPGVTLCKECDTRWSKINEDKKGRQTHVCRGCGCAWEVDSAKKDPDSLTNEEILDCLKNSKRVGVSS